MKAFIILLLITISYHEVQAQNSIFKTSQYNKTFTPKKSGTGEYKEIFNGDFINNPEISKKLQQVWQEEHSEKKYYTAIIFNDDIIIMFHDKVQIENQWKTIPAHIFTILRTDGKIENYLIKSGQIVININGKVIYFIDIICEILKKS